MADPSLPIAPPATTAPAGPVACTSPPPKAASSASAPGPITVPVTIHGTTTEGIDFQSFTFDLDHVAKIRIQGKIADFADTAEKTGVGFTVRSIVDGTPRDTWAAHVDPSTPANEKTTDWLYPGHYDLLVSRATYASANTSAPILPHVFDVALGMMDPPRIENGCTFPESERSATDVRAFPECSDWCKKLPACGVVCRPEDCAIPKGQCEASIRAMLACEIAAHFECVTQGGGHGYSTDAICEPDAKLCSE